MRKRSCNILIAECEEIIGQIEDTFSKAFTNPENIEITVPKVKSFLEHCRSILEYTAQDIFEIVVPVQERTRKLNSMDKNVYFPYGKTKKIFRSNISKNLPGLKSNDEQVYNLLENLQDFRRVSDKEFLCYMCKLTNDNKHDDLSESERQSRKYTKIGNFALIDQSSSVTFQNCIYNGIPMGNFSVENGKIYGNINPRLLTEVFHYEEGEYVFKDTNRNVIRFLQLSLIEISQFVDDLYKILDLKYTNYEK